MSRYFCVMCERPTRYYKFRDDDGNLLHFCKSCKEDVRAEDEARSKPGADQR